MIVLQFKGVKVLRRCLFPIIGLENSTQAHCHYINSPNQEQSFYNYHLYTYDFSSLQGICKIKLEGAA